MTSYNTHQQVWTVGLCSNMMQSIRGTQETLQNDMEANLLEKVLQAGPNWKITYGPVVWKYDPSISISHADNTWFVARCPSLLFEDGKRYETYVVSVAGTMSSFGSIVEDFWVRRVVDFVQWMNQWTEAGIPTRPVSTKNPIIGSSYIAKGLAVGVHTILSYTAPPSVVGAGLSLYQYIQTLANPRSNSKIIFAGHSLGGALVPTIAAAVAYTGILDWPVQNRLVYPSAGVSPGNREFASLYQSLFPIVDGEDYRVWNANIANSLDIVPHAWCMVPSVDFNLLQIPSIYGDPIPAVQEIIDWKIPRVSKFNYYPIEHRKFGGITFNPPETLTQWLVIAGHEHWYAYLEYIGVSDPNLVAMIAPAMDVSELERSLDILKAVKIATEEEVGTVADGVKAAI